MDPSDQHTFAEEVAAIGDVLSSLERLSGPARERVLAYVANALSIKPDQGVAPPRQPVTTQQTPSSQAEAPEPVDGAPSALSDIRTLKEAKQPSSANQMAAVAAYYLSELAPPDERSATIDSSQLDRLFRQASFPLPSRISMTLPNATAAGYFDQTGEAGRYKLNPVGYNLVAHTLPDGSDRRPRKSAKKAAKKSAKKAAKKSAKKAAKKSTKKAAKKATKKS